MSDQDKLRLIYQSLESYPASLNPDQVAEALGVSRRTVDRILEAEKLEYFTVDTDETGSRPAKRVTKASLIEYMQRTHIPTG